MRLRLIVATALLAIGTAPALAQDGSAPPAAADDQSYVHKPSGLTVPPVLDGMVRDGIKSLVDGQLDEVVNFHGVNEQDNITVFIFRNVSGSVPVWFDRTRFTIEQRGDLYGVLTALDRPAPFTPPHQTNASGLMRVWLTGKGPFRSTGVAFMPLGPGWYVNIRYSSATHSAEALEPRLKAVVAALGWPATIEAQPAAAPIADCAAPLVFTARAKPLKAKAEDALMGSLFAAAANDPSIAKEPSGPPPVWCRDSGVAPTLAYGLYRPDGADNSYLVALNDAGRGVTAAPDLSALLMDKKGKPRFALTLLGMAKNSFFAPTDRLPPPDQALDIRQQGQCHFHGHDLGREQHHDQQLGTQMIRVPG